jgi:hypothetical protein
VPCIDGARQNQGRGGRTAASRRHKKAAGSGGPGRLVQRSLGMESRRRRRRPAVVAKAISKGLGGNQLLQTRAPSGEQQRRPARGNRSIEASCILAARR